jgi:hypothetical protein
VFQEKGGSAQVCQSETWYNVEVFQQCFDCFFQRIRIKTAEKVLLIMDNCGPCSVPGVQEDGQIEIINLPAYTTSVYQSMNMCVISMVKLRYKFELFQLLVTFHMRTQLQQDADEGSRSKRLKTRHKKEARFVTTSPMRTSTMILVLESAEVTKSSVESFVSLV